MKQIKKDLFISFIIIFFLLLFFKFFENTYFIFKNDYNSRLIQNYGFCEKSSYGFIKYIEKKYKIKKNLTIINDEIHPSSDMFIFKPGRDYKKNYLILLNYNEKKSKLNIKNFKIIEKYKNCFYLKKND